VDSTAKILASRMQKTGADLRKAAEAFKAHDETSATELDQIITRL
jgi:hypothetical protein